MTAFLPRIMEMLERDDPDVTMKVLELFRNVLGHLTRDEASPIAVLLVEVLPPLFEHVRLMGELEPRRWAPCKDSFSLLQNLTVEHLPHFTHDNANAEVHLSSFPPGVQPAARAFP